MLPSGVTRKSGIESSQAPARQLSQIQLSCTRPLLWPAQKMPTPEGRMPTTGSTGGFGANRSRLFE